MVKGVNKMEIPTKKQLWTYVHENEYDRLKSLANKKQRKMSETLRGILYSWMDEHNVPYVEEND